MGPKGPTSLTPLVARARNCGRLWPVFSGFSGFCSVFVKEVAVFGRIYSGKMAGFCGFLVFLFDFVQFLEGFLDLFLKFIE